jgi:RHS repeat-associated protein
VQVGLYADNAGHPGTLLSQGTVSAPVARGWNAVPVAPASVTLGSNYWIAILSPSGDHAANVVKQATGTSLSEFSQQTTLTSLPSSWSSGASFSAGQISAYAVQVVVDGGVNTTYTYDRVGNRLTRSRLGITASYSYDRADRITQAGQLTLSVNAAGNETARGVDSFGYDQANRLISATVAGVVSAYKYDGDGKRVSKTAGSTTTNYVYDVGGGLPVLLDDGTRKYIWGKGLAYTIDKANGGVAVYHSDGLGSVRAITDMSSTPNVTQTYQTDEFGLTVLSQGNSTQPFGYAGEQRDQEDGLLYLRARVYDPSIGRFFQRDSFARSIVRPSSLDRYQYVVGNPVNYRDPSGHELAKAINDELSRQQACLTPLDRITNPLCQMKPGAGGVIIIVPSPPVGIGPSLDPGVVTVEPPDSGKDASITFVYRLEEGPDLSGESAGVFEALVKLATGQVLRVTASWVAGQGAMRWIGTNIFPSAGGALTNQVGPAALRQGLVALARELGAKSGDMLTIGGYRISGANPGRFVNIDIGIP